MRRFAFAPIGLLLATSALAQTVDPAVRSMTLDEKAAQLQSVAPAIPRLRLPAYDYWNEGLHGLARNGVATVFPQAIGLAATWDEALLKRVGDVVSTEARAKSNALPKVLGGMGVAIISTSQGLLTDKDANHKSVGGEVLAYVW